MILQSIVEFAEKNVSSQPSGFQPRFVTKVIQLRADGTLLKVVPMTGEKSGKREGKTRMEPQESPRRAAAIKPRLFADNVNYVLGKAREKDKGEQVEERHAAWCALVLEAARSLDIPSGNAIQKWIKHGGPLALCDDPTFEEDDEITFEVEGINPNDLPQVRSFWANRGETAISGVCLVTGKHGPISDRMPAPIKGVPDGQMSGTALISVNNAAGESYGLEAALNSPISVEAAEKLCNGLNFLINEGSLVKDEKGVEKKKLKYSLRVGKSIYVAWSRNNTEFDPWSYLDHPDPQHVQQLISQPISGKSAATVDEREFCVLSLSANAARIVVRDYHETTLSNLKVHLKNWFETLSLVGLDGQEPKPIGIYRLAGSLYRDANKEMPAHVPTDLIAAAIRGRPIPKYLLALAVKRNLAMQGPYGEFNNNKYISIERLSLMKAILQQEYPMNNLTELDTKLKTPAYLCGRLLAIYDKIQDDYFRVDGKESPNVTVADRYFGSAAATPGSVLNFVGKHARNHLSKLNKKDKGYYHEIAIEAIMSQFTKPMPATLSLSDQALFTLGFYHQRAQTRKEISDAMAAKNAKDQIKEVNK